MSRAIAVLTSGGDAPGMNAAIRAVVRKGIYCGARVFGVRRGFVGLVNGEFVEMGMGSVADIIHRGGTVLRTGRSEEFKTEEGQRAAAENMRSAGIDGLVVLGGDGSLRGALRLHELGVLTVGVPATIDNDVPCSEMSIGFDTAINTIVDAINKIRDTATSHERTFVVEVMGRNTGHIALAAGLAGGAESILIPEAPPDMEEVCARLLRGYARGKLHSIIVVAEGAAAGAEVAREVEKRTGLETRTIVLGHIQRGGSPTALDRILASRMGALAVDLLLAGQGGKMTGLVGGAITSSDLRDALSRRKDVDGEAYELAGILAR